MKKFLAVLLCISMMISLCIGLVGCGNEREEIEMGDWLYYVADAFGMTMYQSQEPYFKNISAENEYFAYFQMAAEWHIISPDDGIKADTKLTWKDALVSLVNAGAFMDFDSPEEEKIAYAIEHFDNTIRDYWMKRNIPSKEARTLLAVAADQWANKTVEYHESVELSDDVKQIEQTEDLSYKVEDNTVVIDRELVEGLGSGDVYALPGVATDEGVYNSSLNKIESIEYDGDKAIISNVDAYANQEVTEEMLASMEQVSFGDTSDLDFGQIAAIYDEDGNVVYSGTRQLAASSADDYYCGYLGGNSNSDARAENLGFFADNKLNLELKLKDGYKATLSGSANSISLKLTKTLSSADSIYRDSKKEFSVTAGLSDLKLTKDVNISWGKLKNATVKLDYKSSLEFAIKKTMTNKVGEPAGFADLKQTSSLSSIIKGYGDALSKLNKSVYDTKYKDSNIYICKIALWSVGVASVDFVVKGQVTATGELKLTVTCSGAKGIEYDNGNIRYIKANEHDVDFVADGKLELTINPGVELYAFGFAVAEVTVPIGAGVEVKMTAHLFDEEGHEITKCQADLPMDTAQQLSSASTAEATGWMTSTTSEDVLAIAQAAGATWENYKENTPVKIISGLCVDWKMYPIVGLYYRVGLGSSFSVSGTVYLLGPSKSILTTPMLKGHFDLPNSVTEMLEADSFVGGAKALLGIGRECSFAYTPWDSAVEKADELEPEVQNGNVTLIESETIVLSATRAGISKGETYSVPVVGLPKGYALSDLTYVSNNSKIAKVDSSGVVTAVDEGSAMISVATSDNKYMVFLAVSVYSDEKVSFSGLNPNMGSGI